MNFQYRSSSPDITFALGETLGKLLLPGDILCLEGDLGAGKTKFAQGVAAGLGVKGRVTSPTFNLVNQYRGRELFYHMDVYRLGSPAELEDLGYREYFFGDGVTLLEWASMVEDYLPPERLDILIERCSNEEIFNAGEDVRLIKFMARGKRYVAILEELRLIVSAGH